MKYTSEILQYGSHSIRIQATGKPISIKKLTYWPSIKAKRFNASQFTGEWTQDEIGEEFTENDVKKTTSLSCSKIWVYGQKGPNHATLKLSITDISKDFEFNENYATTINNVLVGETDSIRIRQT